MPRRPAPQPAFGGILPLYLVRIIGATSLALLVINAACLEVFYYKEVWICQWVLFSAILVHHLTSLIQWRFFYGFLDLLLILGEAIGCILLLNKKVASTQSWFPETVVAYIVLLLVMFASLVLSAAFRVMDAIRSRLRPLWAPVIFTSPAVANEGWLRRMFGRSIWREHIVGESPITLYTRGLMGLAIFGLLCCFLMINLIFKPMQETALSPIREYHASVLPMDSLNRLENPVWNIIFALRALYELDNGTLAMPIPPDDFFASVNVTTFWPHVPEGVSIPSCTNGSQFIDHHSQYYEHNFLAIYQFQCSSASVNDVGWILPDVAVSVDFTDFIPTLDLVLGSPPQIGFPFVVGLTNNTQVLLGEGVVTRSMVPGVNIMSSISVGFRESFKHPTLAALGIFQETNTFFFPQIGDTFPDPSPFLAHGPNISTIRYWSPVPIGIGRNLVIQDYRGNSVLAGLASIGGLWTSLGGIFAILFGTSILRMLYGSKPLSITGVAHSFQTKRLREQCLQRYPDIISERNDPASNRGLLSLLRDHIVDLDFLEQDALDNGPEHNTSNIEKQTLETEDAADLENEGAFRQSTEILVENRF